MGNDVYIWEMAQVFKRLKNVENDLDIWEIAKIFGNWLKYL